MGNKGNSKIFCFDPSGDKKNSHRNRTIYHYTSPDGLLAILKTPSVRFTDCQFLNDKSEYTHIHIPLEKACEEVRDSLFDVNFCDMIQNFFQEKYDYVQIFSEQPGLGFNNLKMYSMRHYVFCASTDPDLLNMWNYYVKGGNYQGYNIGISVNDMVKSFTSLIGDKVSLFYGPVVYKDKDKIEILKKEIIEADTKLHNALKNVNDEIERDLIVQSYYGETILHIEHLRLFFKDAAFSGEKEYRFVIRMPEHRVDINNQLLNTGFTVKQGVITPHCDVPFSKNGTIKRITIAPMMETGLAQAGLQRYLRDNEYTNEVEIGFSEIPIRY